MTELGHLISAVVLLTADAGTDEAARAFQGLGFVPQVIAEGTLLISGPETLFERRFDTEIVFAPDGLRSFTDGAAPALARSLPITALDPGLRGRVAAIGFEAPPDFGPPSFDQPAGSTGQEVTMPTLSAAVILKYPGDTQAAANGFSRLGFQVTTISAGVLLLTADAPVFEKEFGTALTVDDTGARRMSGGSETRSLPMDALPPPLREMVSEAEFEAPPDFGPPSFDQPAGSTGQEVTMPTLSAAVILKYPGDTQAAANGFSRLGFQVTTISAGVLLLTADAPVFEKEFGTALTVDDTGARRMSGGSETRSLPMDALPPPLREMVSEAEFEAPPDFGPGNF